MRFVIGLIFIGSFCAGCGGRTALGFLWDGGAASTGADLGRSRDRSYTSSSDHGVHSDGAPPVGGALRTHGAGSEEIVDIAVSKVGEFGVLGSFDSPASLGNKKLVFTPCKPAQSPCRNVFMARYKSGLKPDWIMTFGGEGDI